MTQLPDEPAPRPVAVHSNAATQDGFTIIPNLIMRRGDLSPGARLVYGWLKHLAWRERSAEVGPPREQIGDDLGLNVKTVTGYIAELRKAPVIEGDDACESMLVEAVRRGQGRTNTYLIHDPQMGSSSRGGSTFQEEANGPDPARARSFPGKKRTASRGTPQPPATLDDPPAVVMAGSRNVPLDVLMEVCTVAGATDAERMKRAVVALNGRLHRTTGRVLSPGIRHAFWEECQRQAVVQANRDRDLIPPDADGSLTSEAFDRRTAEERLQALHDDPARFAVLLADRIRSKAAAYRRAMPNVMCTPKALLDWWPTVAELNPGGDNVTADDILRMNLHD